MEYRELDIVRVVLLSTRRGPYQGSEKVVRAPRVGDVGTIVHVLSANWFTVECVDDNGHTVWLADFERGELIRESAARA